MKTFKNIRLPRCLTTPLVVILIFISNSFSQTPNVLWEKTFGGSNIDVGYCVQQTNDGGFIISGYTRSYGTMNGRNVWLIKTDAGGNMLWNNTYGGNNDDEGYSVQLTSDGGYIITGYTKSFGFGGTDVYLIKTDSLGNKIWERPYGGTSDDEGYSVLQTSDGGYLIGAATSSSVAGSRDGWILKTDQSGNTQWMKNFGGLSSDGIRSVEKTSDGGYIFTGWTYSGSSGPLGDAWLVKIDSVGNQQWTKAFGGSSVDRGYWVQQTSDGGYVLTGYTDSFGAGLYDMLLIKTDNAGNQQWMKTFGGTGRDYGNSLAQTSDGGYIIAGYTLSYGAGSDDVWLVKSDNNGSIEWSNTYGGAQSDVGYCVKETSDGNYIIVGHTLSSGAGVHDIWLIKTGSSIPVELTDFDAEVYNGNVVLLFTTATELNNKGFQIKKTLLTSEPPDKNNRVWQELSFIKGSGSSAEPNYYSFIDKNVSPGIYLYKLSQLDFDGRYENLAEIEVSVVSPTKFQLHQNYPNPFNPTTTIKYSVPKIINHKSSIINLKIYDILGREIATLVNENKPPGNYEVNFDGSNLSSGVYFYKMTAGSFTTVKKLNLIK